MYAIHPYYHPPLPFLAVNMVNHLNVRGCIFVSSHYKCDGMCILQVTTSWWWECLVRTRRARKCTSNTRAATSITSATWCGNQATTCSSSSGVTNMFLVLPSPWTYSKPTTVSSEIWNWKYVAVGKIVFSSCVVLSCSRNCVLLQLGSKWKFKPDILTKWLCSVLVLYFKTLLSTVEIRGSAKPNSPFSVCQDLKQMCCLDPTRACCQFVRASNWHARNLSLETFWEFRYPCCTYIRRRKYSQQKILWLTIHLWENTNSAKVQERCTACSAAISDLFFFPILFLWNRKGPNCTNGSTYSMASRTAIPFYFSRKCKVQRTWFHKVLLCMWRSVV